MCSCCLDNVQTFSGWLAGHWLDPAQADWLPGRLTGHWWQPVALWPRVASDSRDSHEFIEIQNIFILFSILKKTLIQCEDPRKAALFIEKYDAMVASGRRTHRVADLFCGSQPGNIRADFERWAHDGVMSVRLRTLLTAYQLCNIDDSFQESPHGLITGIVASAGNNSNPSTWSPRYRFNQSMEVKARFESYFPGSFSVLFQDWWSLYNPMQPSAFRMHVGLPVRVVRQTHTKNTEKDFRRRVYRMDEFGYRNMAQTKKLQKAICAESNGSIDKLDNFGKIVNEYLHCVLEEGTIVSFPTQNSVPAIADLPAASSEPFTLEQPPPMFSIFSSRVHTLKTIVTHDFADGLRCPASFMVHG